MTTLVLMCDIPWTALYQRPQALAVEFAKKYDRVIFAEPWHPSGMKKVPLPRNVERIRLWHWPFNARLPLVGRIFGPLSRVFHPLTDWINRKILERAVGPYPDVIFTESPQFGNLVKGWPLTTVVYDYLDRYTGYGELPDWVSDAFYNALFRADLKIATHPTLAGEIITKHVVGQGTDLLWALHRKARVGIYWGYIGDYMDWKAVLTNCDMGHKMILCGPVKGTVIPKHPNLIYLGVIEHAYLPVLSRMADYGFILWKQTPLTETVATVKGQEYLACGLPVLRSPWMKHEIGPYEWQDRAQEILELIRRSSRQHNSSME